MRGRRGFFSVEQPLNHPTFPSSSSSSSAPSNRAFYIAAERDRYRAVRDSVHPYASSCLFYVLDTLYDNVSKGDHMVIGKEEEEEEEDSLHIHALTRYTHMGPSIHYRFEMLSHLT